MSPQAARIALSLALLGAATPTTPARAQALAPMVGASAIQGTLQTIPASGAAGSLERGRSVTGQMNAANQQRQDAINGLNGNPPAATVTLSGPDGAAPSGTSPTAAPSAPAAGNNSRLARVNGRSIPTCSHGGLCHRALLQAIGQQR